MVIMPTRIDLIKRMLVPLEESSLDHRQFAAHPYLTDAIRPYRRLASGADHETYSGGGACCVSGRGLSGTVKILINLNAMV